MYRNPLISSKVLPTFATFISSNMSNIEHRYDVTETPDLQAITYLFFSEGQNEAVLKIIQFAYVRNLNNEEFKPGTFYDGIIVSRKMCNFMQ